MDVVRFTVLARFPDTLLIGTETGVAGMIGTALYDELRLEQVRDNTIGIRAVPPDHKHDEYVVMAYRLLPIEVATLDTTVPNPATPIRIRLQTWAYGDRLAYRIGWFERGREWLVQRLENK